MRPFWQSAYARSTPPCGRVILGSDLFAICLGVPVLTESTNKLRDPLAFGLLAATTLYLLTSLALLFKDDLEFTDRSFILQDQFTNPAWVLVVLAAVALVAASDRPSRQARTVAMVALGLLVLMLLLGIVTWLASYGSDTDDYGLIGKITHTFFSLARLLLLATSAALAYTFWKSLPAPARQPKQQPGQQQWGQQQGQQQWGQQQGQQQWGQQQPGQGQWGAPAAAGGAAWGQQDPYAAPPAPGQPSAGEQAAWGQPPQAGWGPPAQEQPQPAWGQPPQEQPGWAPPGQQQPQTSWDQPAQSEVDPDATTTHEAQHPPEEAGAAPQPETGGDDQRGREDDQRPGWWAPGS
jgi:hypothetical protein